MIGLETFTTCFVVYRPVSHVVKQKEPILGKSSNKKQGATWELPKEVGETIGETWRNVWRNEGNMQGIATRWISELL